MLILVSFLFLALVILRTAVTHTSASIVLENILVGTVLRKETPVLMVGASVASEV